MGAIACAAAVGAQQPTVPADLKARLDAYVTSLAAAGVFSGAVLVARGDEVVLAKGYGMADRERGVANTPETAFALGSMAATFVTLVVAQLAERGALALSDAVGKHLDGWPDAWASVTVDHVLRQASGIPDLVAMEGAEPAGAGALAAWRHLVPSDVPELRGWFGDASHHSVFDVRVAAAIAETVRGEPLAALLRADVLGPAKMEHTGFGAGGREDLACGYTFRDGEPCSVQRKRSLRVGAGMVGTVMDLYRFERATLGAGALAAARRAAPTSSARWGDACSWQVDSVACRVVLRHASRGAGYGALLLSFPQDEVCVIALVNQEAAPLVRIGDDLAGIVFGADAGTARHVPTAGLDACVGVYSQGGDIHFVVRRAAGFLVAFPVTSGARHARATILLPIDERHYGQFADAGREAVFTFEPRADRPRLSRRWSLDTREWRFEGRPPAVATCWGEAAESLQGGSTLRADGERLWLRAGPDAPEWELVPLTDRLALALFDDLAGTVVIRDAEGLTLTAPDGKTVHLRRDSK